MLIQPLSQWLTFSCFSQETIASAAELEPFVHHASQMAALDYIVSVESDVFVPSYSGNMARAVAGHRRFLGHRKTISLDRLVYLNILHICNWAKGELQNFSAVYILSLLHRKALVPLFDKITEGKLMEGKKFSDMVVEIHKRRYNQLCIYSHSLFFTIFNA